MQHSASLTKLDGPQNLVSSHQKETTPTQGTVVRIAGPVVHVIGLTDLRLFDVVLVGEAGLIGEVIRLERELATIQVYEDTSGLRAGEPVISTGAPLMVELGPGLLGSVYDGLQRPLASAGADAGIPAIGIERGLSAAPLPRQRQWPFGSLQVRVGQIVEPGDILGFVPESRSVQHAVLVPPGVQGRVADIHEGMFTVNDVVAVIDTGNGQDAHETKLAFITLRQQWPVRHPRPYRRKLVPNQPLITGTRVIDTFFPIANGGTAIIPGGFGTGKTVTEQTLARWADADVVVYVGCGERGNEMAEVLEEFPHLEDPRHGGVPLMERTILIANTSNMPVAAREASIYTGITLAEYYRDMGHNVLLLADSTSRWGEALREISGRLEEMPGEEGYPAYLAARLSEFYERSGRVACLGNASRTGSVTIVGAVSPPGGDFSEPITQNSLRVVGTFWALDYDLSRRRHFPAINWIRSYTLYQLQAWFSAEVAADWPQRVGEAMALLQQEAELLEIVQLVGPDALAAEQREVLAITRMLREDFLQQSAVHEIDRFCSLPKAYWMLRVILAFHDHARKALRAGHTLETMLKLPVVERIARMRELPAASAVADLQTLEQELAQAFARLAEPPTFVP